MELKQYFRVIRKKVWLLAMIVVIVTVASAVKSIYFTTPYYQASAKLIVNQTTVVDGNNVPNVGIVQANIMLINSYKEIITSAAILKKVIEKYPDLRPDASNIAVGAANNSQVMSLAYVDTSYERAAKTVNAISTVFKEQIPLIMKVDNVTILNGAYENAKAAPINSNPLITTIIGLIVSLLLGIGLAFLLDYLDNTFKSEVELEEALGLPMLAAVSKITKEDMRRYKQPPASKNEQVGEGKYATIN